jgi:hypothetical protein
MGWIGATGAVLLRIWMGIGKQFTNYWEKHFQFSIFGDVSEAEK